MIRWMLDTGICIELLRGRGSRLPPRMKAMPVESVSISSMTLAELQFAAAKSARAAYHHQLIAELCAPLQILAFDSFAAEAYGVVRATLEGKGTPIGSLDTLIAGHALSRQLTLITRNFREFNRVDGLDVDSWN